MGIIPATVAEVERSRSSAVARQFQITMPAYKKSAPPRRRSPSWLRAVESAAAVPNRPALALAGSHFPPPRHPGYNRGMRAIGRSNAAFWIVMALIAICAVVIAIDPTLAVLFQTMSVVLAGFAIWLGVGLVRREKWAICVAGLIGVAGVMLLVGFAVWIYLMSIYMD